MTRLRIIPALALLLAGCEPRESVNAAEECFAAGGSIYATGNVGLDFPNGCIKELPADTASSIVIDSLGNPIGGSAVPDSTDGERAR